MADNFVTNAGSGGSTFRSTDNAGVHSPHTKLEWGGAATANPVEDVDAKRLPIKPHQTATATRSQVADTTVEGIILAANGNRKGGQVYNDSSAVLLLGLGTTVVSATNYTAKVYPDGLYTIPGEFTGQVRGLWESDPNDGGARVTELV
jgi:hypothetical protein